MSKPKIFASALLALILVQPAYLGHGRLVFAQEAQQPQTSTAPAKAENRHQADQRDKGRLLVKEEEGEVDPNVVFRHSWAVRTIARITGLSIDGAFWLCMALNFSVVIVALWMLLRKIVPALYRNRMEAIQRRLEEARKTSEEASRRLSDVEARLSRLDTEIEQMRREAEASAHHEEGRVLAAAEEERRRIVESTEQEIARAAGAARRELKAYAAELGVNLAEKRIRIEENTDQKLVREFASQLERDATNGLHR